MAKNEVIDVATVAQSGVTVKRSWKSLEIWNYALGIFVALFGLLAFLAPIALPFIADLGLSTRATMAVVILLNGIIYVSGWVLKLQSKSLIGSKTDVAIAKDATQ